MQERKNKMRLILLAVLTVSTILVFLWVQPENRMAVDQDIFKVEDLNTISKVELITDSAAVTLAYDGTAWRVNNEYRADADLISVLFATLQQAIPKRNVADVRQDSIYRQLKASGVEVLLYDGDKLKRRFIAGGNSAKTQAYFADPTSQEVYVMTIPGYRVYVSGILELSESGWRDKFVFGFNWRNFKSLKAEFPQNPASAFTVSLDRNHFGIEGLPEADTARLNTFLDDVSLLTVDEYIFEPELRDSLLRAEPSMRIEVMDVANRIYALRLYDAGPPGDVLGIIQDAQLGVFDRRKIEPLFRRKSFFQKK